MNQLTRQQTEEFKAEFRRRQIRMAVTAFALALPLYGVAFSFRRGSVLGLSLTQWVVLWLAVAVAAFGFGWRTWRCPACNSLLGRTLAIPACPKCGLPLK
jgi:cation transport ATPase